MDADSLPQPRAIALEGASNLRDLGGYRTATGQRVRFGILYRSATLATLTDRDVAAVAALGLRTIVDLRGEREAAARPSRLPNGATRIPLGIEPTVGASLHDLMLREQATGEDVVALLRQAYLDYGTRFIGAYRGLFDLLLDPARHALLFHCSAGKDRTGLGAALVLTALGADRATILADYAATDRLWRRDYAVPAGTPKPLAEALYATHPALLQAALEAAIAQHGSLDGLLQQGLGLTPPRLARLRALLLEPG